MTTDPITSSPAHGTVRLSWRARLLLGGYPPWWRLRYDDEMQATVLAMQQDGHWRAKDSRDLIRGLVGAWLNPDLLPQEGPMHDSSARLVSRTAWGLLLFVLAGGGFAKILDDPAMTTATTAHPAIRWPVHVLMAAAGLTALVMLVASGPYLAAITREHGYRPLRPLLTIPVCAAVVAAVLVVAVQVAGAGDGRTARQIVAFAVLVVATVGAGIACTAAVLRVASRAPETEATRRTRRLAMAAVAALTSVGALAVVAWIVAVAVESPSLLHADDGLLSTPTMPSLAVALLGLAVAAVLCGRGGLELSSRPGAPRRTP